MDEWSELQRLLADLVQRLLETMPEPGVRPAWTIQFEESGASFPFELRPDQTVRIVAVHAAVGQLASFRQLLEVLRADQTLANHFLVDAGNNPVAIENAGWWVTTTLIQPVMSAYLDARDDAVWDAGTFDDIFAELLSFLTRTEDHYVATAPLDGFASDSDLIEVGEGVTIRRMTEDEKTKLFEQASEFPLSPMLPFDTNDLLLWNHQAHLAYDSPKLARPDGLYSELFADLVAALRLLHEGWVGTRFMKNIREGVHFGLPFGEQSSGWRSKPPGSFGVPPGYHLAQEEEPRLSELFSQFRKRRSERTFALALRRFNNVYERVTDEDRLIDCWIALESLFLPDGMTELSYRVALRVARFLGEDRQARERLFRDTKVSYNARSKIVHGEAVADLHEVAISTKDTLRQALRLWLDPARDHGVKAIDSLLLA